MNNLLEHFRKLNFTPKPTQLGIFENHFQIKIKRNAFPNSKLEFISSTNHELTYQNTQGLYEAAIVLDFEFGTQLFNYSDISDKETLELTEANPELLRRYDSFQIGDETFQDLSPRAVEALIKTSTIVLKPRKDNLHWCYNLIKYFVSSHTEIPSIFEGNQMFT